MSRAELIYPIRRQLEGELAKTRFDPHNSDILDRYYKVRSSEISIVTSYNEMGRLNIMSKILGKKFEDVTVQDIENLIFECDKRCKRPGTANKYRKIIRQFYRWLRGSPYREFPPEVKWIRMKKEPLVSVTENDMISYDECIRITEMASNLRDKALFQCKLDAGCRIGEILTVKIGEVEFNGIGAVLQSDGKTGKAPLILTWSAKTLAMWLNIHPFRDNPEAPLWPLSERQKPVQMSYSAAHMAFKKCVRKSGCKKRVWPHLFKHVSSSHDSEIGLPDSYRKYKHHWTPNSKMAQVYEHLSASVIPKIQAQTMKLMDQQVDESQIQSAPKIELSKKCARCDFENPRDSTYCNRCAFPLNESVSVVFLQKEKVRTILEKLAENPEKLERLISAVS